MKEITRGLALVLAAVLMLGTLAACGGNGGTSQAASSEAESSQEASSQAAPVVSGEEQTWGNFTLLVPEGMTLKGGSLIDPESEDSLTLTLDENEAHYIMMDVVAAETAEASIDATKEMNEGSEDVTLSAGADWKGCAYKYAGMMDCFQLYAAVGGKTVMVRSAWFAYDDDTVQAVLSSLQVK